jgi:preprotein translocase subunit SecE
MKKEKVKTKNQGKGTGQMVRLKAPKGKTSLVAKLPPVAQWWRQITQFVSEAWQELNKVTWPGRKETLGTTAVVLVLVIVISSFLGLVDMGLSAIVNRIMKG